MTLEIDQRQSSQPSLFAIINGLCRKARLIRTARFHFNKDNCACINGHQVQFTQQFLRPAGKNLPALSFQVFPGYPFSA